MKSDTIENLISALRLKTAKLLPPMSRALTEEFGHDPFVILISCLLSLRARDTVTHPISLKLFTMARTPQELLAIPVADLEKLLYPLGFFRRKTQILRHVCQELIDRFSSKVPSKEPELRSLPGVGLKTANLVRAEAFGIPAICVDTHVHRLANYLGLVHTTTPEATEAALRKIIPIHHWIDINKLLVMCGQNRVDLSDLVAESLLL